MRPMLFSHNGSVTAEGKFDWADAIIDAAITGSYTAVGMLAGLSTAGAQLGAREYSAVAIAFATSFFGWMATKRGLVGGKAAGSS